MRIDHLSCLRVAFLLLAAGLDRPASAEEAPALRLTAPVMQQFGDFSGDGSDGDGTESLLDELESETAENHARATELVRDERTESATETDHERSALAPPDDGGSVPTPSASPSRPPLSPQLIDLRNRLRRVLATYYPKHQVAPERSCWEVMHGIIAYGVDAQLFKTANRRQSVNAIGWMCYNQPCHGEQLFYLDRGKFVARQGPGLQGHTGQFLAIIAQSHVSPSFPMKIGGKNFTVQDLIDYEKSDCRAGEELTFKLIALSHYLGTDDEWTTRDGQKWNVSRLIREELKQPILRVAACGGTHRLMGHSYALYKRRKQGLPIDGQFARAERFIADYHKYTYSLQNADGSFSTKWFEGREARPDIDRRIKTTGHIFEWMCFSVPEEQLQDPRMVKAANYLVTNLLRQPNREWEAGPIGHALHSLRIYDRRLFKPYDSTSDAKDVLEPTTASRQAAPPAEAIPAGPPAAVRDLVGPLSPAETSAADVEPAQIPAVPPIEPIPARTAGSSQPVRR